MTQLIIAGSLQDQNSSSPSCSISLVGKEVLPSCSVAPQSPHQQRKDASVSHPYHRSDPICEVCPSPTSTNKDISFHNDFRIIVFPMQNKVTYLGDEVFSVR